MKAQKDYKSIFSSLGSSTNSQMEKQLQLEREEYGLSLRKRKMNNYLMKKREKNLNENEEKQKKKNPYEINISNLDISEEIKNKKYDSPNSFIDSMIILLESNNINEIKFAITNIRQQTNNMNFPITEMYNRNIVDKLMLVLFNNIKDYEIIYEVTWTIINFVTIINNQNLFSFLTNEPCLQIYIMILNLNDKYLIENILWLICNTILGNSFANENLFFSAIPRNYILKYIETTEINLEITIFCIKILASLSDTIQKIHSFFDEKDFNNTFFQRHEKVSIDNIKENIFYLEDHITIAFLKLMEIQNEEILNNCLFGLSNLSNCSNINIHGLFFSSGLIRKIVINEIKYDENFLSSKLLQLVGNFLSYFDGILDPILQKEILLYIFNFLKSDNKNQKRDSLWTFSNLLICENVNISNIINSGIMPEIIEILKKEEISNSRECLFIIDAIVSSGEKNIESIINFIKNGEIIKVLISVFEKFYSDKESIKVILDIFTNLFSIGMKYSNLTEGRNIYLEEFQKYGGNNYIEKLQSYNDQEVNDMVESIIKSYFNFNII